MRLSAICLGLGLAVAAASPASAVEASLGLSAGITVGVDGSACATVTSREVYAGQFAAAGVVTAIVRDGVMIVVPIAGAQPISGIGSTTVCIPGAPAYARGGPVVYELTVTTGTAHHVEVLTCTFNGGPTCV